MDVLNPTSTIAYFDASHDMPEELIMAAGFIPYKILGDVHRSTDPADQYIFQTHCPASRSILTEALENPNKWAGIIIAHGCDATNRQFDIWKMHVETPWLYWLNKPLKLDESARRFFKEELKSIIEALESHYTSKITDENIKKCVKVSNELKELLQKLSQLRSKKDISNSDYFDVVRKAVQSDKTSIIEELNTSLENWKEKPDFPSDKKRVFLTGSDITYIEWMELMDESGLRVVRDDLSIGERYFARTIPETDDPLDGIIEYHFNIPRPATKHGSDTRLDLILDSCKEDYLDGVVSQNLKFCEPYAFDSVFIKESLNRDKIPNIHLERDYTAKDDEQMRNRLEAFKELL